MKNKKSQEPILCWKKVCAFEKGEPKMSCTFFQIIEDYVGLSIDQIRGLSVDEQRNRCEDRVGKPLKFISHFPFIGRGNVLRDRTSSHQKIEKDFERTVYGC